MSRYRRTVQWTATLLLMLMLWAGGCTKPQTSTPPAPGAPPAEAAKNQQAPVGTGPGDSSPGASGPRQVAAGLVEALLKADSLEAAVPVAREILARGGMATVDGAQRITPAVAPAASATAILPEVAILALEAQKRPYGGALDLEELGSMLEAAGWPFGKEASPGEQLADMLAVWLKEAEKAPEQPVHFTIFFLDEMAKRQLSPVDLASGDYFPTRLRLSRLEAQLLFAFFDRVTTPLQATAREPGPGWSFFGTPAYAAEPCTDLKKWWTSLGAEGGKENAAVVGTVELSQIVIQEGFGQAIGKMLQMVGMSEAGAGQFGNGMSAMGTLFKLLKLATLYDNLHVQVTPLEPGPVHKPLDSDAARQVQFKVQAGLTEKDWEEFKQSWQSSESLKAIRDCMGSLGLPTMPNPLDDIAKEAENWSVEWRLVEGGTHAMISEDANNFDLKGQLQHQLKRDSAHSAAATLKVDILEERGKQHAGTLRTAPVIVQAQVETSAPPSLGTWVNPLKGLLGAADSVIEMLAGLFQEMKQPTAYGTVMVEYHTDAWTGSIWYLRVLSYPTDTQTGNDENWIKSKGYTQGRYEMQWEVAFANPGEGWPLSNVRDWSRVQFDGPAQISYRESDSEVEESLLQHPIKDCRATVTSTRDEELQWSGAVAGDITIQPGQKYSISVASNLWPKIPFTRYYRSYRDSCIDRNDGPKDSDDLVNLSAPSLYSVVELDPSQPGRLKGRRHVRDEYGYLLVEWEFVRN